ncbi:aquaporin [Candidatus Albibeggiatoa sp. nov. NOAA]|uniref:aquaporin n=1 Tax=Candidatus Albibeggiatoa sp. nov. NOAA TaxID=3162724 RepID=UPI00330532C9|nr:aquaporin [Thiotrichaceae bacterium]
MADKQFTSYAQWIAEFLGSTFLVMAAIAPVILFHHIIQADISIAVMADALAVGFVLFALIEIFAPISGAHFNPIVSLCMFILQRLSAKDLLIYLSAQFSGGFLGMLGAHLMFYDKLPILLEISSVNRNGGAYPAEIFGTFILVLAILLLVKHGSQRISLVIGLLVAGALLTTSSTMFANPQVTVARMFTYSAAGIQPVDAAFFIVMQVIGMGLAILAWKAIYK